MSKKTYKIITMLVGIGILSAVLAIVYAPGGGQVTRSLTGQKPAKKELKELWAEAERLRATGDYEAALAKLDTILAIDNSGKANYGQQALLVMGGIKNEKGDSPEEIADLYARIARQHQGSHLAYAAAKALARMADNDKAFERVQAFYKGMLNADEGQLVFSAAMGTFGESKDWQRITDECWRVINTYPDSQLGGTAADTLLRMTQVRRTPTELIDLCRALMQQYPNNRIGRMAFDRVLASHRRQEDIDGLAAFTYELLENNHEGPLAGAALEALVDQSRVLRKLETAVTFCKAVIDHHPGTEIADRAMALGTGTLYGAGDHLGAVSLVASKQFDVEALLAAKADASEDSGLLLLDGIISSWIESSQKYGSQISAQVVYQGLGNTALTRQADVLAIRWYMKAAQAAGYKLPLQTPDSQEDDFTYQRAQAYLPNQLKQKAGFWKALLLWNQDQAEMALPIFQELLTQSPESPESLQAAFLLANYHAQQEDYPRAEVAIAAVHNTYPDNASVKELAEEIQSAVESIGQTEGEIETLKTSLASTQEPEAKAQLMMQIADLQVSLKRYEVAAKTLLQIPEVAPRSLQAPQAMLRAAQLAHNRLGDLDLAKTILDGLFINYPDSAAAESALELAEQIGPNN